MQPLFELRAVRTLSRFFVVLVWSPVRGRGSENLAERAARYAQIRDVPHVLHVCPCVSPMHGLASNVPDRTTYWHIGLARRDFDSLPGSFSQQLYRLLSEHIHRGVCAGIQETSYAVYVAFCGSQLRKRAVFNDRARVAQLLGASPLMVADGMERSCEHASAPVREIVSGRTKWILLFAVRAACGYVDVRQRPKCIAHQQHNAGQHGRHACSLQPPVLALWCRLLRYSLLKLHKNDVGSERLKDLVTHGHLLPSSLVTEQNLRPRLSSYRMYRVSKRAFNETSGQPNNIAGRNLRNFDNFWVNISLCLPGLMVLDGWPFAR